MKIQRWCGSLGGNGDITRCSCLPDFRIYRMASCREILHNASLRQRLRSRPVILRSHLDGRIRSTSTGNALDESVLVLGASPAFATAAYQMAEVQTPDMQTAEMPDSDPRKGAKMIEWIRAILSLPFALTLFGNWKEATWQFRGRKGWRVNTE